MPLWSNTAAGFALLIAAAPPQETAAVRELVQRQLQMRIATFACDDGLQCRGTLVDTDVRIAAKATRRGGGIELVDWKYETPGRPKDPSRRNAGVVMIVFGVLQAIIAGRMLMQRTPGTAKHHLPAVPEQMVAIELTGRWDLFAGSLLPFEARGLEYSLVDPASGDVAAYRPPSLLFRVGSKGPPPAGHFEVDTPGTYRFRVHGLKEPNPELDLTLVHPNASRTANLLILAAAGVAFAAGGLAIVA